MLDPNKFEKLRSIRYRIAVTCGVCEHGCFPEVLSNWGNCDLHAYGHHRYTGNPRGVPIHRLGTCPDGQMCERKILAYSVGTHSEFLEDTCRKS